MYSLKCNYPKTTAKGIKKNYIKRHVRHSALVDALPDKTTSTDHFKTFRSVNHIISTSTLTKFVCRPLIVNVTFYLSEFLHLLTDIIDNVGLLLCTYANCGK